VKILWILESKIVFEPTWRCVSFHWKSEFFTIARGKCAFIWSLAIINVSCYILMRKWNFLTNFFFISCNIIIFYSSTHFTVFAFNWISILCSKFFVFHAMWNMRCELKYHANIRNGKRNDIFTSKTMTSTKNNTWYVLWMISSIVSLNNNIITIHHFQLLSLFSTYYSI
jgi:hypothetical protein